MTRTGVSVATTALLLLAANAGAAFGDVRREQTERRPYIVEIGQPYEIGVQRLQDEINHISELKIYVRDYGYPDYSEIQEVSPDWPWEAYEVRLYYMRRNLEVDFSPVILSEATPNFGVLRFRGDITPEKRHEIEVVLQAREAPPPPPEAAAEQAVPPPPPPEAAAEQAVPPPAPPSEGGVTEALVARIEAAAERATQAADQAAQASEAAARAAERTINIVDKMEREGGPRE
jgi:hypothetical protein